MAVLYTTDNGQQIFTFLWHLRGSYRNIKMNFVSVVLTCWCNRVHNYNDDNACSLWKWKVKSGNFHRTFVIVTYTGNKPNVVDSNKTNNLTVSFSLSTTINWNRNIQKQSPVSPHNRQEEHSFPIANCRCNQHQLLFRIEIVTSQQCSLYTHRF